MSNMKGLKSVSVSGAPWTTAVSTMYPGVIYLIRGERYFDNCLYPLLYKKKRYKRKEKESVCDAREYSVFSKLYNESLYPPFEV